MKTKKSMMGIIIVILVCIIVVGIVKSSQNSKNSDNNVIHIGAILPLTGSQAVYGTEVRNALLMAQDNINKNYSVKCQINIEDSQDNPGIALAALGRIENDKQLIATINGGSAVAMSLAPEAERKKLAMIATLASDEELTKISDWSFRAFLSSKFQAESIADYASKGLSIKNISLIVVNNDHGHTSADCFVKKFTDLGGKILSCDFYDIGAVDLKAIVSKAIATKSEAVYVFGYGVGYLAALNQLSEFSYEGKILTMETMLVDAVQTQIKDKNRILYFVGPSFALENYSSASDFKHDYYSRFQSKPSHAAAYAYDTLLLIANACNNGVKTREELKNWLVNGNKTSGVLGEVSFNSERSMTVPMSIFTFQNGKITQLSSIE